jgi:hypothetical protein
MTWRIEIGTGTNRVLLGEILTAQSAWGRLTKAAREAVEAAYPDGEVEAHPLTINALERHGFLVPTDFETRFGVLTEAGKAVAKWCVKP